MTQVAAVIALVLVAFIAWLAPVVICAMKGKNGMAIFAFVLPAAILAGTAGALGIPLYVAALASAIRLAKPDSRWAKRYYDEEKTRKADERFATLLEPTPNPQDSSWDDVDFDPAELDPITRRALKKSGRL